MEITPMIVVILKVFLGLKVCQYVYNVGIERPSWGRMLNQMFELVLIGSMIMFGFNIILEIPTWEEFSKFGHYLLMNILWIIIFILSMWFNNKIKPYR